VGDAFRSEGIKQPTIGEREVRLALLRLSSVGLFCNGLLKGVRHISLPNA
jgi:hypothetical protein